MGDLLAFKRPRNKTIRGHARECLTEAIQASGEPRAIVIIVMGKQGEFAIRSAYSEEMQQFDVYARAGAIAEREKMACIADQPE